MGEISLPGSPEIRVRVRRSAQARRLSLRISGLDGQVTLTLPRRVSTREGAAFVAEKADWIRQHLARQPDLVCVAHGVHLPIEGETCLVQFDQGRGIRRGAGVIAVAGKAPERRLERWLRELARERLVEASDHYAAQLGRGYSRVSLRDTRSRWGSCSSAGALMYSWRLILAPREVLRYVAAHEVAHLAHMNHSGAFWNEVTRLYGAYEAPRRWLRSEGNALHRYRFETRSAGEEAQGD